MGKPSREPSLLSSAIAEVIALRGLARSRGNAQLEQMWRETAGDRIASKSKPLAIKRAVLHVEVDNAALLNELVAFHRLSLLSVINENFAEQNIENIKFRLRGKMPAN